MKTLAVVFWVMAGAGSVAYCIQSQPAAAPAVEKPVDMKKTFFGQVGLTKTLVVTPPAPDVPYSISLLSNNLWGLDGFVGFNPADKPSIYPHNLTVEQFANPTLRNILPVVWVIRTTGPYYGTRKLDGTPAMYSEAIWSIHFRKQQGLEVYGGGKLKENLDPPFFTNQLSATAGWSFRLTD